MLRIGTTVWGSWTVLRVHGEIDMATAPRLRQEFVAHIGRGNRHLVVDLGDVDFIDSTGLGVLIGGLKRARAQGGDLKVTGVGGHLEKVFDLTGLGEVLVVVDPMEAQTAEVTALP